MAITKGLGQEPQAVETLKLFMPLSAESFERNQYGDFPLDGELLNGGELREFANKIHESLLREREPEESERGMMHYYPEDDAVNRKVQSYVFTVEEREGQLWGVAECQVRDRLTPEELEALMENVAGQASDGFGEGFEQRPIRIGSDELYVHLWNSEGWDIMTEAQRFGPEMTEQTEQGGMIFG